MRLLFFLAACTAMAAPAVKWGNIPLSFEPNQGQTSAEVRYLARGSAYTLYLGSGETLLMGRDGPALGTRWMGANHAAGIVGEERQASTSNYFAGSDPSQWRAAIANYGRVRYRDIYPGIDLTYYGNDGNLEYDWIVAPGADPNKIRMRFGGASRLRLEANGDLVVSAGESEYRHRRPLVYQDVNGKRTAVAGRWALQGREAAFRVGAYDRQKALVIDPVLLYSTYEGGNGLDWAYAIAVDQAGNTYVAGGAGSANFPAIGGLQGSLKGTEDVFVTKINANGSGRVYSTFLGGGGPDEGKGIAVDSQGNAYVTGSAGSFDFPMVNAIQGTWGGSGDAFLAKLNPAGSALVYSTYLGGNGQDYGTGVAIDPFGNAYVIGVTFSTDFPTVNPFQAVKGAQQDAFVAKINPAGTAWVYSTYLGGNNVDEGYGIAADVNGNAYVTGYTESTNFPVQSPLRGANAGTVDAFVTKLNAAGSALVFSTYLGGTGQDYGTAIAQDSSGVYVAGVAGASDFPVVNPAQPKFGGVSDAFVAKLNPAGSALLYSTFIGGGSEEEAYALAIDGAGNAYVTGRTNSSDFPLTAAIQSTRFAFDMFVTELNATGTARLFSTYIGGTGSESGRGIAVDRAGNIHVAGEGTSPDFPVVNAIQGANGGGAVTQDAFVLLLGNTLPTGGPAVTSVLNAESGSITIAPNTWVEIKGVNLAPTGDARAWQGSDFVGSQMPAQLDNIGVTVNGKNAYVYYISPTQVNILTPPDAMSGPVQVVVTNNGASSASFTAEAQAISPSFFVFNGGPAVAATHANGTLLGPATLYPGASTPAQPGEVVVLYANGFGPTSTPLTPGSAVQSGTLSPLPQIQIGGLPATVQFAGLVGPGEFQFNVVIPASAANGDLPIVATYNGQTTQAGTTIAVHN